MNVLFRSANSKFGLEVTHEDLLEMLARCEKSWPYETGGILVGAYNDQRDTAIVTDIPEAPPDSRAGKRCFNRGVSGLKEKLAGFLIASGSYYLGEWHFHPGAKPTPSAPDIKQMTLSKFKEAFACPEPALLIVGGNPNSRCDVEAFVFPNSSKGISLNRVSVERSASNK